MRVGWLADYPQYVGGAELTAQSFMAAAPKHVQIVPTSPEEVSIDVDCYVIHNCVDYSSALIPLLSKKPCLKYCHDVWPSGDPDLRSFLLHHAKLLFCSPKHVEWFDWPKRDNENSICPPAIDYVPFQTAKTVRENIGLEGPKYCWIGRYWDNKGVRVAAHWAEDNGIHVDFYGTGPSRPRESEFVTDCGHVPHHELPGIMAQYTHLIFMPLEREPFGRSVAEAHFAGLDVTCNQRVGALHFIENDTQALLDAPQTFWSWVESIVQWNS